MPLWGVRCLFCWGRGVGRAYDPGSQPTYRLSHRQKQVLELVACGLGGKEIAASLHIKYQTAKNHFLSIRRALGAQSNSHAVRIAMERKLIEVCQEET